MFPNTVGKLGDEKSDRLAFKNHLAAAGVSDCQLYQFRKTAFTNMTSQTDLKTLMDFPGHSSFNSYGQLRFCCFRVHEKRSKWNGSASP